MKPIDYQLHLQQQSMAKKVFLLISFLGYMFTLVHSFVPHHHHDQEHEHHQHSHAQSEHHHHNNHHESEDNALSHAFADIIHVPGSEIIAPPSPSLVLPEYSPSAESLIYELTYCLSPQLNKHKPGVDPRLNYYSSCCHQLFLLRAPPTA
jgi:hypothetical protein